MHRASELLRHVLFWLVLVISVILIVLSFAPRCLGYSSSGISDESMQPMLRRGDLVLTKPVPFEDVRVGDLLTFADLNTGERFTRIVAEVWTEKQELVTRSAEGVLDPYTTAYRCVVGRAVRIVRFIGYPSVWLQTIPGKIVLALLYIIWIAAEIEGFAAQKRREQADA